MATKVESAGARDPVSLLESRMRDVRAVRTDSCVGMLPVSKLPRAKKLLSEVRAESCGGMVPMILREPSPRDVRSESVDSCCGMLPENVPAEFKFMDVNAVKTESSFGIEPVLSAPVLTKMLVTSPNEHVLTVHTEASHGSEVEET